MRAIIRRKGQPVEIQPLDRPAYEIREAVIEPSSFSWYGDQIVSVDLAPGYRVRVLRRGRAHLSKTGHVDAFEYVEE